MPISGPQPSSWSNRRSLLWAVGIGLLCGAVLGVVEGASIIAMLRGNSDTWLFTIGRTLPAWLLLGAFGPAFASLARRFSFERHNLWSSIVVHAVVGVVAACAHLAAYSGTYVLIREQAHFWRIFNFSFRYLFLFEFLIYWASIGIYLTIHLSNLRRSLAEARLLALRTQLNPHFLFNSLHAISTMSLRGEHTEVAEMLGRLSDLLRAALDGRSQEVPLSSELDFIEHYTALQRIRYGDRLQIDTQVSAEALEGLVPTMILQPLVENAIKYGVSAQRGLGTIAIRAKVHGETLVVEVQDDGPGFDPSGILPGIGLSNTEGRLEQLYGRTYRFELARSSMGGASVRMVIPYRKAAVRAAGTMEARDRMALDGRPRLAVSESAGSL